MSSKMFLRLISAVVLITACEDRSPLSGSELDSMLSLHQGYVAAWKSNDPARVKALFTSDPVIVPSGMEAIEGTEAVNEFWWPPEGSPTHVVNFEMEQTEYGGFGDFGYVRGSFTLAFTYEGELHTNTGEYLSLLKKGEDGWKISHHMWNDRS